MTDNSCFSRAVVVVCQFVFQKKYNNNHNLKLQNNEKINS